MFFWKIFFNWNVRCKSHSGSFVMSSKFMVQSRSQRSLNALRAGLGSEYKQSIKITNGSHQIFEKYSLYWCKRDIKHCIVQQLTNLQLHLHDRRRFFGIAVFCSSVVWRFMTYLSTLSSTISTCRSRSPCTLFRLRLSSSLTNISFAIFLNNSSTLYPVRALVST